MVESSTRLRTAWWNPSDLSSDTLNEMPGLADQAADVGALP